MKFGNFDLMSLSDGTIRLDGGAMFGVIPKPLWERRIAADARNRIPMGLRPLLIRTDRENILIDAGVGEAISGKDAEIYGLEGSHHLDDSLASHGTRRRRHRPRARDASALRSRRRLHDASGRRVAAPVSARPLRRAP